jgi:hypothetical protein
MTHKRLKKNYYKSRIEIYKERFQLTDRQLPVNDVSVPVNEVVKNIFDKIDFTGSSIANELQEHWRQLAGKTISKHTRPGFFSGTILIIYVDNTVWLSEVTRYHRQEMFNKLKKRLGGNVITAVKFRLDPEKK